LKAYILDYFSILLSHTSAMATTYTFHNRNHYLDALLSSSSLSYDPKDSSSDTYVITSEGKNKKHYDSTQITAPNGEFATIFWKAQEEVLIIDGAQHLVSEVRFSQSGTGYV
jgi:hypothetical protein